jgi:hypothetical protein
MDVLGWLWWSLSTLLGLGWSLVWFLLGGWVATLAQLAIAVGVVFSYKYGWRRAPLEMASRGKAFARFVWGWMRAREMSETPPAAAPRTSRRPTGGAGRPPRDVGDVNLSTLMSIAAIAGLGLIAVG